MIMPGSGGASAPVELRAGLSAFASMSYVTVVIPLLEKHAGFHAATLPQIFMAACIVSAFGSLLLGGMARLPLCASCGIGINAIILHRASQGHSWQVLFTCCFLMGFALCVLGLVGKSLELLHYLPSNIMIGVSSPVY
jgi:AGZA family xanthine/uracil permease-like MFS transporter